VHSGLKLHPLQWDGGVLSVHCVRNQHGHLGGVRHLKRPVRPCARAGRTATRAAVSASDENEEGGLQISQRVHGWTATARARTLLGGHQGSKERPT
jgi:hypothetical protein